jgi:hypothetical protein
MNICHNFIFYQPTSRESDRKVIGKWQKSAGRLQEKYYKNSKKVPGQVWECIEKYIVWAKDPPFAIIWANVARCERILLY